MKLLAEGSDAQVAPENVPGAAALPGAAPNSSIEWQWKAAIVVDSMELRAELALALSETGATKAFELSPTATAFEIASAVDRDRPEVLFVEFARIPMPASEWLIDVRRGGELPLIIAVHPTVDPAEMISALRAGASEFLSIPVRPAIFEAMERIGVVLEARLNETVASGRIVGVLSAKGGCGATTLACCLSTAMQAAEPGTRILIADMDYQAPGVPAVFRRTPKPNARDVFDSMRRLTSSSWREFVISVKPGIDVLPSPADNENCDVPDLPEAWRMESLLRFIVHHYNWILIDLGRHLNPGNWSILQHVEELMVVTAPDVLALYQTRSMLQTLTSRGFDKGRVKLVLNKNHASPADFWVESIQQMFEMTVFGVLPNDEITVEKFPGEQVLLAGDSPLGKSLAKMTARLLKTNTNGSARRAA
jgi:pilus assembly protein CpaE